MVPLRRFPQLLAFAGALLNLAAVAPAQQDSAKVVAVTATLLTDTAAIAPGKPFTAGVPAYLLCRPGETLCDVLPEILNKTELVSKFDQLP